MSRLIALCGRSGCGKDVVASRLVEAHGFRRVAIADPLKEVTRLAFDMSHEQLWGGERNSIDERWGATPRAMYQQLGDALRSIHPEALLRGWMQNLVRVLGSGIDVIVPDVRLPAEASAVRDLGGSLWRVLRPEPGLDGAASGHFTETASDGFDVDAALSNSATVEALHALVDARWAGR